MSWKTLLEKEVESTFKATSNLFDMVESDKLNWKPASGSNWMTTGQLLMHIATACGSSFKGFLTGDWGLPEGVDMSKLSPEEMLPPAEKMPTVMSLDEAKQLLEADKKLSDEMLAQVTEDDLETKPAPAPWDPTQTPLGHRLLQMVQHMSQHKAQLFYYLKLQGKPVNTGHLYGM